MRHISKETNKDLTVVFLTANEHPEHWRKFHAEKLLEAVGSYPMITIHRTEELNFTSDQYILDTEPQSHYNMYRQLLKAAKLATTPFIATAESDTLYPKEHFTFFRPKMDEVAYDMTRWTLFTWRPDFYSLRYRISNCTLIAPREYLIDALEERYGDNAKISPELSKERVSEVGRHIHENALGLPRRNTKQVWCHFPTVQINHPNGTNFKQVDHPYMKNPGEVKAYDIPGWGKASDLVKEYR